MANIKRINLLSNVEVRPGVTEAATGRHLVNI